MQHIETVTLASNAASMTFSSIPQTFTDLLLVFAGKVTDTGGSPVEDVFLRPNNSTTNLSSRELFGLGTSVSSATTTAWQIRVPDSQASAANTFGNAQFYLPNYTSTTTNKSVSIDYSTEANATNAANGIVAGLWSDTSAITSLVLIGNYTIVAGSSASLFGILAGSDGIVAVS